MRLTIVVQLFSAHVGCGWNICFALTRPEQITYSFWGSMGPVLRVCVCVCVVVCVCVCLCVFIDFLELHRSSVPGLL